MGDYAMKAPAGLLMRSHGERHPTELADLHGRRLVAVSETEEGRRLDERLVKEVTGGDTIRARRMREDFWEFEPSHQVVLVTNHKPVVRGTDNGIWRRIRLIPFTVTIPTEKEDKQLKEKLKRELPLILKWIAEGCIEWQRSGLRDPSQVMAATSSYKTESDTFALWFDGHMKVEPRGTIKASMAWECYQKWCETYEEKAMTARRFGERMAEKIVGKRSSNGTWYDGVTMT
jgi:putative DNA primase/helicase